MLHDEDKSRGKDGEDDWDLQKTIDRVMEVRGLAKVVVFATAEFNHRLGEHKAQPNADEDHMQDHQFHDSLNTANRVHCPSYEKILSRFLRCRLPGLCCGSRGPLL